MRPERGQQLPQARKRSPVPRMGSLGFWGPSWFSRPTARNQKRATRRSRPKGRRLAAPLLWIEGLAVIFKARGYPDYVSTTEPKACTDYECGATCHQVREILRR